MKDEQHPVEEFDKESNSQQHASDRRRLLRTALVGSGFVSATHMIPEQWAKPVVESIVLPAHAATTEETDDALALLQADSHFTSGARAIVFNESSDEFSRIAAAPDPGEDFWDTLSDEELLDYFVKPAYADCDNASYTVEVCVGLSNAYVQFYGSVSDGEYSCIGFYARSDPANYEANKIEAPQFSTINSPLVSLEMSELTLKSKNKLKVSGSFEYDFGSTTATYDFSTTCSKTDIICS